MQRWDNELIFSYVWMLLNKFEDISDLFTSMFSALPFKKYVLPFEFGCEVSYRKMLFTNFKIHFRERPLSIVPKLYVKLIQAFEVDKVNFFTIM